MEDVWLLWSFDHADIARVVDEEAELVEVRGERWIWLQAVLDTPEHVDTAQDRGRYLVVCGYCNPIEVAEVGSSSGVKLYRWRSGFRRLYLPKPVRANSEGRHNASGT